MTEDITPEAVLEGRPSEPTAFYTWTSYVNEDFADGDDPGTITLSLYGVRIGNAVVHMCNGTMVCNPINVSPISLDWDQYMVDSLPPLMRGEGVVPGTSPGYDTLDIEVVWWDPQTCRYTSQGEGPGTIRHWTKPEDPPQP